MALDRERRVTYNNRRFEELLGVEPGTLFGLPASRLFPGADARWLKGASREAREFKLEAEGRELTLKAEALPIRDEEGELLGSVGRGRGHLRVRGRRVPEEDRPPGLARRAVGLRRPRDPESADRDPHHRPVRGLQVQAQRSRREDLDDVIRELDRIEQNHHRPAHVRAPAGGAAAALRLHQALEKTLDLLDAQLRDAQVKAYHASSPRTCRSGRRRPGPDASRCSSTCA